LQGSLSAPPVLDIARYSPDRVDPDPDLIDHCQALLEAIGTGIDHLDEFEGIRIAFVDVPAGPACSNWSTGNRARRAES
jgi:hypothetical protein